MVQSCVRSKVCKLCWMFLLLMMGVISLLLWRRAVQDGAVQLVVPRDQPQPVNGLTITILPEVPRVKEGDTAQLVCISSGASVSRFFPPSSLSPSHLSSVHVTLLPGGAVLVVEDVATGHSGLYTCQALGPTGQKLQLSVKLTVDSRGGDILEHTPSPSSPSAPQSLPPNDISTLVNSSLANSVRGSSLGLGSRTAVKPQEGLWRRGVERDATQELARRERESAELAELALFQRAAVDDYCSRYDPLPSHTSHPLAYSRHTLLDQTHRVLFCFLPKVGCTNLKLLYFVSQGLIPSSELDKTRDKIDQDMLMTVVHKQSLEGNRVAMDEDLRSWDYFKYVMVRNPLERLASAYRSKIERYNLTGKWKDVPHYNWARDAIYKQVHPHLYKEWVKGRMKEPITISFSDFITYWLHPTLIAFKYDDHFMSFLHICQPCRTRFDFYGNFRHFDRDAQVLVERVGAISSDLRQSYYSDDTASTDQRMRLYYSTLSEPQKRDVLRKMALELEFHYTIFPEERDCHKQILGIDADLPLGSA